MEAVHAIKHSRLPLLVEEVKVEVVKPMSEVFKDRSLHLLPEGAVVEVPRWLASILEKEGYAKLIDREAADLSTFSMFAWREERSPSLLPAQELLYVRMRALLEDLSREASVNVEAHKLKSQVEVKTMDIMKCRIQKIVQAALSPSAPKSLLDNLTPEEKFLYEKVKHLIHEWFSMMPTGGG